MFYADDTQLFITSDKNDLDNSICLMETCICAVKSWMDNNFLRLNDDKTEFIIFRSKYNDSPVFETVSLTVGGNIVHPKSVVRNLGVYMDKHLNMDDQINSICKSTMYHIRQVGQIRRYLDKPATEKLIHATICSRLDYTNSLLCGATASQLFRLQKIQNTAARIVCRITKRTPITQFRQELHWLPIHTRIEYKILILAFRAIHSGIPAYLHNILSKHATDRPTRSHHHNQLKTLPSRTKSYGDRAFSRAAPRLWNALPPELRSVNSLELFKAGLKTILFLRSY